MSIVVTGGRGTLGREVMDELTRRDHPGISASRSTGADLRTGAGLDGMLADANAIIHCASNPARPRAVDLDGTRRMIEICLRRELRPHIVYVSIIGVDVVPYPYYRAKRATEIALERSGLPVTVVRASQFHSLVATLARVFSIGPVAVVPAGFRSQPCEVSWVADRLVDLALGDPPNGYRRSADLAGPERVAIADVVITLAQREGKPWPRLVTVPAWGRTLRAFAAGGNLPGPEAELGGRSFRDWLATELP